MTVLLSYLFGNKKLPPLLCSYGASEGYRVLRSFSVGGKGSKTPRVFISIASQLSQNTSWCLCGCVVNRGCIQAKNVLLNWTFFLIPEMR